MLGAASAVDALRAVCGMGPRVVVLKRAEQGALALAEGKFISAPIWPVDRVVDPVGAGDGFDAGFLAGWLRGFDMPGCLALGARVGAEAVRVAGDYQGYPRAADIWPE